MKVEGIETFYLNFLKHFIELYGPLSFRCIFIAVSPPPPQASPPAPLRYFYNFTTRDALRDDVFKQVFGVAHANDYDFLAAFTSAGCVLLDLVYFPAGQSAVNQILGIPRRNFVVKRVLKNIRNLVRCCEREVYIIKLYGKPGRRFPNIENTMREINDELKKRYRVREKELKEFFPTEGKYTAQHRKRIIEALKQLGIFEELQKRIKEELQKLKKMILVFLEKQKEEADR